jgi:hypothetical protein
VAGALVVVALTALSAVRTIVVPRGVNAFLARFTFVTLRRAFDAVARRLDTYERQDALMALFAPLGLLLQPVVWLVITGAAYAVAFYAVDPRQGFLAAAEVSGSSLFTLGMVSPGSALGLFLAFTEAALGLGLVALLITYLPSIYSAFSRREAAVQKLDVRAGSPPSPVAMITRFHVIGWLDRLDGLWQQWEDWFVEVQETHTSLTALVFFRSPRPEQSWVTAAGCVLDAASLSVAALDVGKARMPDAELAIRAGYLCLNRIAEVLAIEVDHEPAPDDPISVTRDEFEGALDRLAAVGVPLVADRDAAWKAYAGWRVNYDRALLGLASAVAAPVAPWSSDRSPTFRPRLRRR